MPINNDWLNWQKHYWRSSGVALFAECGKQRLYRCEYPRRHTVPNFTPQNADSSIDAAAAAGRSTILLTALAAAALSMAWATLAAVKAGLAALKAVPGRLFSIQLSENQLVLMTLITPTSVR